MAKRIRTLQVRHVDAGSCNGCEQEITALTGRDYDIQRIGLDIVASPRHADALLVTGPVVDTMFRSVERVWEAIPAAKIRLMSEGTSSIVFPSKNDSTPLWFWKRWASR